LRFLVSCLALATLAACQPTVGELTAADKGFEKLVPDDLRPLDLLIFYAWPSTINVAPTPALAATQFADYDVVVLGEGLEKVTHPDHLNTVAIIADPLLVDTDVFGYVDLGVTTQNLPQVEIELRIDEWIAAGADGIFFDDFGYDFGVDRARQNAAVDYAHGQGIPVVANGFFVDDVFGSGIDATYNPAGLPTSLDSGDFYLFESHQITLGNYVSGAAWQAKATALEAYRASLGFGVFSITTEDAGDLYVEDKFWYAWFSAAMYEHTATGWGEIDFSALDSIAPYRTRPTDDLGTVFAGPVVDSDPIYTRNTDLGQIFVATNVPTAAFSAGSVVLPGSVWRYLDTGVDPGASWADPAFDDSLWLFGQAPLGYGEGDEATVISYGLDPANKHPTTWFRAQFDAADPSNYVSLKFSLLRDDGAIVYLNGVEQYRDNMPVGPVDMNTPAASRVDGADEDIFYEVIVPSTDLVAGSNVVAVEVHQHNVGSNDLAFDLELSVQDSATVIRGPYLNKNTEDSIVVKWRTDIPTDGTVEIGAAQGALALAVTDPTVTVDHEVDLTGLSPDTLYHYAVGNTIEGLAGDDGLHTFRTSPAIGTEKPSRFWFVGDSGMANADAFAVRDAFWSYTGALDPDLFVMLGDNAYNNGTDEEYQAAVFDTYPTTLKRIPVWSTMGNHDVADAATMTGPYYDIFTFPMAAEAGGVASSTEAYYSFDYANVHFICLDSMDSNRAPGGAMLTWLEADLIATTQQWIVAFWHHPPYSKGSHDSDVEGRLLEMRGYALPLLEEYGVDLVLSGHSHSYERSFLIDQHYDLSTTFDPAVHGVDMGSGDENIDGAYFKSTYGMAAHEGSVYITAGSSGKVSGGFLNHPAMYVSMNTLGSVSMDVDANRMDVDFIDDAGAVRDSFSLFKGSVDCPVPDADDDVDGHCTLFDNCPAIPNTDQFDSDGDGVGELCDLCPAIADPLQGNLDGDGFGDFCDPCINDPLDDGDGDGFCADVDVCPDESDPSQLDADGDGIGDVCDLCVDDPLDDYDGDGICGDLDVCPFVADPGQTDTDTDGIGDACDLCTDLDSDGVCDPVDNCVGLANGPQVDVDGDGIGDLCDSCPLDPFDDLDGDGFCGDLDNCPFVANPSQDDADGNGLGDACDVGGCADVDADGICDVVDNCPDDNNPTQVDGDSDRLGDACDACGADPLNDYDGDGLCGDVDVCPFDADPGQEDADGDGVGDACDLCPDLDADGACEPGDNCPGLANAPQDDGDFDGVGDACDVCGDDPLNDEDGDGICGDLDVCPTDADPLQEDVDGDGRGAACDACDADPDDDLDGDGVCGDVDNCPLAPNFDQADADADGLGDVCDLCADLDADGACDTQDNCLGLANPLQIDLDGDGAGDDCDLCPLDPYDDQDADTVCGDIDNCPFDTNLDQADSDGNGVGDVCDSGLCADADLDGICDVADNCVDDANPLQEDDDADNVGDLCDTCAADPLNDWDVDGVCGDLDLCPFDADPGQQDTDGDGVGDACDSCLDVDVDGVCDGSDNCPGVANPAQMDVDFDGAGDDCDLCPNDPDDDVDGDGICGDLDLCPTDADPGQEDADGDGLGDACDACIDDPDDDLDGDGVCGDVDVCPLAADPGQEDTDGDGVGDACDLCEDGDADGACDPVDNCVGLANAGQEDADADGRGDACDACVDDPYDDLDGDGVCGDVDLCPFAADPAQVDTDGDGVGDVCDVCADADSDGACDGVDNCPGLINVLQLDADGDGMGDDCDLCPADADNDIDGDGVCGDLDLCPLIADAGQEDLDVDGLGDACDACPNDLDNDVDGDGVCGDLDNCPDNTNSAQTDSDGDGIGDVCDDPTGDTPTTAETGDSGVSGKNGKKDSGGCACNQLGGTGAPGFLVISLIALARRRR